MGYAPTVTNPGASRGPYRHVFRWDLDKTYLKTEFDTVRDLVRMARLTAEQRENIPGSASLLRAIKASGQPPEAHAVFFISGSPDLMRAVVEKKFSLDGFTPDGIELKPTLSDVLRGRFKAVRSQVAYKLEHLLRGRAHVPIGTPETLFGDNAENDAFIYALYADALAGRLDTDEVESVVRAAGAYPDQVQRIRESLDGLVHEPAVRRVVIHVEEPETSEHLAAFRPLVVPVRNHLQTALVLVLDGTLPSSVIRRVVTELIERYGFHAERLIDLTVAFLETHPYLGRKEARIQLATELEQDRVDPRAVPSGASISAVLEAAAEAAARTAEMPWIDKPEGSARPKSQRDYQALWSLEVVRAEQRRRRRVAPEALLTPEDGLSG